MPIKDKQNIFNNNSQNADMKKQSLKGGAVTLTTQGLSFLIQMASTMILARILTPQDYGMMAMVVAITGLAGILSSLGLSTATIQMPEINHSQISNLFWINAALGLIVTLIVASLSPVVAWFYNVPELTWIMLALSSTFFIGGLGVQHRALLTRQMRFFTLAKIELSSMVVGIAVAIILAYKGHGYWALVLNGICAALSSTIGAWLALRWIPGLPHRDSGIRSMLTFGSNIAGFNVINYFSRNLDNVLIGRYCGGSELGLYSKAYQLLMMPITNLRDPLNKVAMPALSRLQNDPEQYRNYYIKFTSILAFVSMPLVVFMFVCSDNIIGLVLGSRWIGSSELFKILALSAFIQPVVSSGGLVLLSSGQGRRYFKLGVISAAITCISFFIGLPWGAKGVALAYSGVNYLLLYPTLFYALKNSPIHFKHFIIAVYKPLVASLVMGIICIQLHNILFNFINITVVLFCLLAFLLGYLLAFVIVSGGVKELVNYYLYVKLVFSRN